MSIGRLRSPAAQPGRQAPADEEEKSVRNSSTALYRAEVIAIAVEAGKLTLLHRGRSPVAGKGDHAGDVSPATQADLAANQYITEHLQLLDPAIPIISEESKSLDYETRRQWHTFWHVDPLDGTKEFIRGNDEFTVDIALIDNAEPVLGVIYAPAKELLYYGEKGQGGGASNAAVCPGQKVDR